MGKVVFLDVDGTLVDYENHFPVLAVKVIRKARENGHRVYICTGSTRKENIDQATVAAVFPDMIYGGCFQRQMHLCRGLFQDLQNQNYR